MIYEQHEISWLTEDLARKFEKSFEYMQDYGDGMEEQFYTKNETIVIEFVENLHGDYGVYNDNEHIDGQETMTYEIKSLVELQEFLENPRQVTG